ncbi:MAG: endonuclease III domain-containing protein [Waddliaceae bacterium]
MVEKNKSSDIRITSAASTSNTTVVLEIYRKLYTAFGPQHWWPAETPFEVIVGAILTQNTAWRNVEKAISHLREKDLLRLEAIHLIPENALAESIRPSGYYNLKAHRLKELVAFIYRTYDGQLDRMFSKEGSIIRKALLSVNGLGPETVDSILLYAGEIPFFVVDAYTRRIGSRHRLFDERAAYQEIQDYFMTHLPHESTILNEYHALLVKTAKDFCKKKPGCSGCPLNTLAGFESLSIISP